MPGVRRLYNHGLRLLVESKRNTVRHMIRIILTRSSLMLLACLTLSCKTQPINVDISGRLIAEDGSVGQRCTVEMLNPDFEKTFTVASETILLGNRFRLNVPCKTLNNGSSYLGYSCEGYHHGYVYAGDLRKRGGNGSNCTGLEIGDIVQRK
jgi:hypothetical protein